MSYILKSASELVEEYGSIEKAIEDGWSYYGVYKLYRKKT